MRIFSDDCSPNQITCKDGQCIGEKHWLCDGNVCPHNKCEDHSDEEKQICGKYLFSVTCIFLTQIGLV